LRFDWTNSGISFTVNGTGAKATFTSNSLSPNPVYVNVYVDDDLIARNTICMEKTRGEYVLADGLTAGTHTITLRKRNEAVYGGSATWGIVDLTAVGGTFGAAPADATRHIEVIGDSITAGFGNLDVGSKLGYNSHTSDGTSTYATLTAAALGADIDVIARSGIRFIREKPGDSMYPVYEQISGLNGKCTETYDFASHPKDVVIINLGTNDAGAGQTDEYVKSETKAFLQLVRKNNPNSLIVWAYGIMGNGKTDAIQAGIKEVVDAGDNKLFFFPLGRIDTALENIGTGNHPTVVTAINRSFDLSAFIAEKLGWECDYKTQLAQMLKIAEGYDSDYLSTYSNASIQALTEAVADAKALPATASNDQIKAAVAAIQSANKNLELALDEAAVLGAQEKTATGHFMRVDYTFDEIDPADWEGRPLYLRYEVKASTTNEPANDVWKRYIQNGRVWFGSDYNNRFVDGNNLGAAEFASPTAQETEWLTVTLEIPTDKIPESINQIGFYYYNDTGNMADSDKAGVAWDNNSGVTLHIRNVRLMTTNLDQVVKSVLKTRLEARKSAGNLLAYTDESVAEYNALFDAAQAVYDKADATQDEVNAAAKSIKNADGVLKLKDENTVAIFFTEERTANESHYLSLGANLDQPLDLNALKGEELALIFDIRFDTTESFTGNAGDDSWMPFVRNGKLSLFTSANVEYPMGSGAVHCKRDELADAQAGEWLTVSYVLPKDLLKSSDISRFFMYIYNDTANAGFSNDLGVTFSMRDVHISKTGNQVVLDPKEGLNNAIADAEAMDNMAIYTADSVAAFNQALAAAKAVSADDAATQEQIDAAEAALIAANEALELDPANIVALISSDTLRSGETHYLSIDRALAEPLSLADYQVGDLWLSFDIKLETTERHPDPENEEWIRFIRNGQIRLFSVPAATADNSNGIPLAGDGNNQVHCRVGVFENIQPKKWLSVSIPVPEQLYTDGQITKFHMFIYNDMVNMGTGWSNDNGVVMNIRNLRIAKAPEENPQPADKTALNAAIAAAQAKLADGKTYTADTLADVNAKLADAQAVAANADADQATVDAAAAALNDAVAALVEETAPAVVYGDVDGKEGVTAADALMALQAATGKIDLTAEQEAAADVDGTPGVSASDALLILQFATGKIDSFPVEKA
ncbi:MAG: GDSL-type esterase/lipase family protein, partial [Acutalibacteraceae bacterium]